MCIGKCLVKLETMMSDNSYIAVVCEYRPMSAIACGQQVPVLLANSVYFPVAFKAVVSMPGLCLDFDSGFGGFGNNI